MLSSLLLLALAPLREPFDVLIPPPPNTHTVEASVRLGIAEGSGPWIVGHPLVAGESFSSLAKLYLGDGRRYAEVAALNPELDPTRLRIGQVVWVPPRRGAAGEASYLYRVIGSGIHFRLEPYVPNSEPSRWLPSLAAVPAERRAEAEARFAAGGPPPTPEDAAAAGLAYLAWSSPVETRVPDADPTVRLEVEAQIASAPPRVEVLSVRRFDAAGAEVPAPKSLSAGPRRVPPEPEPEPTKPGVLICGNGLPEVAAAAPRAVEEPPDAREGAPGWLAGVAVAGACGLAWIALRRRRAA